MHSILVTGGAGFIGSNFVRFMLKKYPSYRIIVLDALTYAGNRENLSDLEKDPRFIFYYGNICDRTVVDNLVSNVDAIVNFAAETHVDRSIHEADSFVQTDVLGTLILLEAAKKYNIERYLQISTDEVYGSIEEGAFTEEHSLAPNSPYSASKAGGDMMVRAHYKTYGTPTLITRASNNYGPFQYPEKLIPFFVTNAIDSVPLPLYGDGMNVRDWLYVDDHCEGVDHVLHHGVIGETYNIGGGNEKTNIDITNIILKKLNKPDTLIKRVADRPGHDRRYAVDTKKIEKLGWKPRFRFEEAIAETIQWYVKNESWWRKIKEKQKAYQEFLKKNYEDRK
ncbi:dTDP-glucose 4,6-dehydratase [bacterium]|nr:MAG: dTDP-glucose 4,6-dehydratase [bacterium]